MCIMLLQVSCTDNRKAFSPPKSDYKVVEMKLGCDSLIVGVFVTFEELQQNHLLTLIIHVVEDSVWTNSKAVLGNEMVYD